MSVGFTKPGSAVAELEAAYPDRLKAAEALFSAGRHGWAVATGLYALEIRLKALICRRLDLEQLPRAFEVHDLASLLLLAGLSRRIERKPARNVKKNWDRIVETSRHLNEFRYTGDEQWAADTPEFFRQLRDPPSGVLPWLDKVR